MRMAKQAAGKAASDTDALVVKKKLDPSGIPLLTLVLFIICAIVSLTLGAVNYVTAPRIAAFQKELADKSRKMVLEADSFVETPNSRIFQGLKGGEPIGFAIQVAPRGYGGTVKMMVGIDLSGKITGVSVISHTETPGIGTKIKNTDWLQQFIGKTKGLKYGAGVDAISGATISSKAVLAGINEALDLVLSDGGSK